MLRPARTYSPVGISERLRVPTTGAPLYVRLWYLQNGTWYPVDYTYTQN
ncbi:MAG TPA: hypothetical protein VGJ21_16995 [Terracidiphilus sp.]|jgi:hypothetical protein